MSILLTLDQSYTDGGVSHDFETLFDSPIPIPEKWEIALQRCDTWYSFFNISAEKGNNTFKYTNDSAVERSVTIPDGVYSLSQLQAYLHYVMRQNSDYTTDGDGNPVYSIYIQANYSTLKSEITISDGYELNIAATESRLYELLGFEATSVSSALTDGTHISDGLADVTDGLNSMQIHVSLVSESYMGSSGSDVIFSFIPTVSPGSPITIEPRQKVYLPIRSNDGYIRNVRCHLTDQQGRVLDLNGEKLTVSLHLRKIK